MASPSDKKGRNDFVLRMAILALFLIALVTILALALTGGEDGVPSAPGPPDGSATSSTPTTEA